MLQRNHGGVDPNPNNNSGSLRDAQLLIPWVDERTGRRIHSKGIHTNAYIILIPLDNHSMVNTACIRVGLQIRYVASTNSYIRSTHGHHLRFPIKLQPDALVGYTATGLPSRSYLDTLRRG